MTTVLLLSTYPPGGGRRSAVRHKPSSAIVACICTFHYNCLWVGFVRVFRLFHSLSLVWSLRLFQCVSLSTAAARGLSESTCRPRSRYRHRVAIATLTTSPRSPPWLLHRLSDAQLLLSINSTICSWAFLGPGGGKGVVKLKTRRKQK